MKILRSFIISMALVSCLTGAAQKELNTVYRVGVGELIILLRQKEARQHP